MRAGMPAGLSSLVVQVQAVFTVILAVILLMERITARRITGMGVAFAGLALIAVELGGGPRPPSSSASRSPPPSSPPGH
jgi:O-acetylserine/cysteine efflux transporter